MAGDSLGGREGDDAPAKIHLPCSTESCVQQWDACWCMPDFPHLLIGLGGSISGGKASLNLNTSSGF